MTAKAQQIDPVHGKAGSFVLAIDQKIGGSQLDAGTRQAALAVADKLLAILRRDPAIATPVGYSLTVQRAFGKRTEWVDFDSGLPFFAGVYGTFFKADARPSPNGFGSREFGIYANTVLQCPVNTFKHPEAKHPWLLDGKLPVIQGGRATGEFRGHTIYDAHCIVLSHKKDPPFVPLTREQYLQLEIGTLQERLDSVRQEYAGQTDATIRSSVDLAIQVINQGITQRKQELDSMDPETRRAPAFVGGGRELKLVDAGEDGAIPLSVPNAAFFDLSLPPATVQAVSVVIPFLQSGPPPTGLPADLPEDWRPATERIRDQLDWAALEALIP